LEHITSRMFSAYRMNTQQNYHLNENLIIACTV
jgi:hypothetical protein